MVRLDEQRPLPRSQLAHLAAHLHGLSGRRASRCAVRRALSVTIYLRGGAHCGSYKSFGIASLAWDLFEKSALP